MLRRHGYDCLTASHVGLAAATDDTLTVWAWEHGAVVVSTATNSAPVSRLWHQFLSPRFGGMRRNPVVLAVCGVLSLTVTACTSAGGNDGGTQIHSTKIARPPAAVGRSQAASLVLPAGRSSAQYRITAPSPAKYEFDVTVTAPASAKVSVNAHTWYGAMLGILTSTRDLQDGCKRRGSQDVCFERFPLLPAQRAGIWKIVASKGSGAAAKVRVAITFAKP